MDINALRSIGYGMYIIGSRKGDRMNAQVANTVFQITSQPPTIAVSINKNNLTHEYIRESGVFSASVLCQDTPLAFIGHFGFKSGREMDKLKGIGFKIGETGAPVVLDYAVSFLEARVVNQVDLSTHTIFIGEVVNAEVLNDKTCLTYDYYQKTKRGTTPKTAPSYIAKETSTATVTKYRCIVCNWIYDPSRGDPDGGIPPGVPFEELPDNWLCPVCGARKDMFEKVAETPG